MTHKGWCVIKPQLNQSINMAPLGWLGRKTSAQTNNYAMAFSIRWTSLWHLVLLFILTLALTLKAPRKLASENVVCLCRLLNILANFSNLFLHTGKQCGSRSDCSLGARCLQKQLLKQKTKQTTVVLSLPLIQEGQLSVSGKRMCTILVNRLED